MLDFHDSELQNMSYDSFCRLLVYRFCNGLVSKDIDSITTIYSMYSDEWRKIFLRIMQWCGNYKAKLEAIVCYVIGCTLCFARLTLRKHKN